ncbi:hypothetical protein OIE68_15500 [Nocardia vinacea]|uniref:hypothetical protein n=1 Tax=Nocardia vinacea TaxID=96468 RepID=UPI002E152AC9|nr:hypothetical protein OIE68_15500 [Nocardia vinacea]
MTRKTPAAQPDPHTADEQAVTDAATAVDQRADQDDPAETDPAPLRPTVYIA